MPWPRMSTATQRTSSGMRPMIQSQTRLCRPVAWTNTISQGTDRLRLNSGGELEQLLPFYDSVSTGAELFEGLTPAVETIVSLTAPPPRQSHTPTASPVRTEAMRLYVGGVRRLRCMPKKTGGGAHLDAVIVPKPGGRSLESSESHQLSSRKDGFYQNHQERNHSEHDCKREADSYHGSLVCEETQQH